MVISMENIIKMILESIGAPKQAIVICILLSVLIKIVKNRIDTNREEKAIELLI